MEKLIQESSLIEKEKEKEDESPSERPAQDKVESLSERPSLDKAQSPTLENANSIIMTENQELDCSAENVEIEVNETKITSPKGSETKTLLEEKVIDLINNEIAGDSSQINQKLPVVLTFETLETDRKSHVYGKINARPAGQPARQNIPPPPSYYPSSKPDKGKRQTESPRPNDIQFNRQRVPQPNDLNFGQLFINPAFWCPYPNSVPPNTPPCLALLVDVDSLFVVKNFEIVELLTGYSESDLFLIQNKHGECLYYAYELFDIATECCDSNRRGCRLIVRDLYQNEVMVMNKFCGCNIPCFFCCYPLIEVYAPPSVPIGAVVRVCESSRDDYLILDADENKIFRIYGSIAGNLFPRCSQLEYTIHALDNARTKVGHIKRQFGDFRTYTMNAQVCGISFPADLDVRTKSIFLGALMLIQISYFS